MGLLPFEREAVLRRRTVEFQGVDIPLPTPEDLIIFKSISQRSQDQEDIKDILNRNPRIDKERVLSTVKEFSEIMEKPEIYNKIRSLLT
jgi:predicted nucleotidyltransferase